jgi:glyoxylase-like metal-dependent hydrolase (beta-lactamase superfamily II)
MNLKQIFLQAVVALFFSFCCCSYIQPLPPIITFVSVGYHEVLSPDPSYVSKAAGSITLVQSNGKNVLVDTGTSNMATFIKDTLWNAHQLKPDDINLTFITHTHPDHYSNVLMFSNEQSTWTYNVTGDIFTSNPLQYDKSYFLFNDNNLEVWATPGHMPQDCSLLVHNWNNTGTTMGIVGDLFYNASDSEDPSLWTSASNDINTQTINRRRVACAVDYIIPGHGSMFPVTNDMKENVFTCNSSPFRLSACCYLFFLLYVTVVIFSI